MVKCPTCEGSGKIVGMACPGFRRVKLKCFRCKGSKVISDEENGWIVKGKAIREARLKRNVSAREIQTVVP